MFSASSNERKLYCYLDCAFGIDGERCVTAEEHPGTASYEGVQGFHPHLEQGRTRRAVESEHSKAGCGKG